MSELEARCGNTTAAKKSFRIQGGDRDSQKSFFADSNPGISLIHRDELSNATFSVLKFHI